jgi:hypothetical protein
VPGSTGPVQQYPVRVDHRKGLALEALEPVVREVFGDAAREGDHVRASFGALKLLIVRPVGKELGVETTMDPKVSTEVARETIARYNRFLETATGYSTKERAKRLRKSAGEG